MNIIYSRASTNQAWSVPKSILSHCEDFDDDEEMISIRTLQIQTSDYLCTSVSEIRMQEEQSLISQASMMQELRYFFLAYFSASLLWSHVSQNETGRPLPSTQVYIAKSGGRSFLLEDSCASALPVPTMYITRDQGSIAG